MCYYVGNGVRQNVALVLGPPASTRWVGVKNHTVRESLSEMS